MLDIVIPKDEYELAVVTSSLLENVVQRAEANGTNKIVAIRVFPLKKQFMIEVKNSYNGTLVFSKQTGLQISKKGASHGYGLLSVQAYANKTGAILQIDHDEKMFHVQLLLN